MDELYQQIIDTYQETGSVKKTAEALNTYPIKVRRVLITEGLWHSKTSDQVMELLNQGLSVEEIAQKLVISEKNVQSYMPYTRGQYGGEDRSSEAIRSEEYRERMKKAGKNQVTNTEARAKSEEEEILKMRKMLDELRAENERLLVQAQDFWNNIEQEMKRIPMALELHLELDMEYLDEDDLQVLKKYGRMEKSISRDFIVPGNMNLHALHYAIMKAFGWQNSHLHSYVPDSEEFELMTNGGKVSEWTRLVGMYFRFPGDNFEDIYWDDDYEEDMSIKSWLKSKYCGPYIYGGTSEYYLTSQLEVERFRKEYPKIQKKTTDQRKWGVYFEGQCEEMLEKSIISTVLATPADASDWDKWKWNKKVALKEAEADRLEALQHLLELFHRIDQIENEANQLIQMSGEPDMEALMPYFEQLDQLNFEIQEFVLDHEVEAVPVLSNLIYRYDYGDGWEIKITCTNAWFDRCTYARDEEGRLIRTKDGFATEKERYLDAFDHEVTGEFMEKIKNIEKKEKPVCTAWDGINLVDDVGGVSGFCDFLRKINGKDPEAKKFYKDWAKSLGWTGRMSKPENVL